MLLAAAHRALANASQSHLVSAEPEAADQSQAQAGEAGEAEVEAVAEEKAEEAVAEEEGAEAEEAEEDLEELSTDELLDKYNALTSDEE